MTKTINYEAQAEQFLKNTNTLFKVEFLKHDKHFPDDKDSRDIYLITLTRGKRSYSFNFGQSLNCSGKFWKYGNYERGVSHGLGKAKTKPYPWSEWDLNKGYREPTAYDVLASITKYDPEDFKNFCSNFGYNEDSRTAEKVYKAVLEEYTNIKTLFNDEELELLQEIN